MNLLNRLKNKLQAGAQTAVAPKAAAVKPLDIKKVLAKEWSQPTQPERAALAHHFKCNAYPHSFEWNWKQIDYNRMALVTYVTSRIPNCAYLEIGCDQNALFDVVSALDKTGVDPGPGGTIRRRRMISLL
jgi:hypothetical protein